MTDDGVPKRTMNYAKLSVEEQTSAPGARGKETQVSDPIHGVYESSPFRDMDDTSILESVYRWGPNVVGPLVVKMCAAIRGYVEECNQVAAGLREALAGLVDADKIDAVSAICANRLVEILAAEPHVEAQPAEQHAGQAQQKNENKLRQMTADAEIQRRQLAEAEAWFEQQPAEQQPCVWTPHRTQDRSDGSWYVDGWDTACGRWQNLDEILDYDDAVQSNGHKFCGFCGAPLERKEAGDAEAA